MRKKDPSRRQPELNIQELQARLAEAEDALRAIRSGEVDAVVVSGPQGDQVFTLQGADQPYRVLVETMNEGAATLLPDGAVMYCNSRFSEMVRLPLEQVIGSPMMRFLSAPGQPLFRLLLEKSREGGGKAEFTILAGDGNHVPVQFSLRPLGDAPPGGFCLVITDLTEQKRSEAERSHLAAIVESSEDAIIGKTLDGTIVSWNRGAQQLYGYPAEEVVGRSIALLQPGTHPGELPAILERMNVTQLVGHYETERVKKDGTRVWVSVRVSPVQNATGSTVGASEIGRDITARKRAEEEIQKLNKQLERRVRERTAELESANKELEAFTYSVSHDLRAPLRHVDGFSRLLVEDHQAELSPDAQECVATIRDAVRRMGVLIDDLLNLARLGRKPLAKRSTDLNSLVKEVISDLNLENTGRVVEWNVQTVPFVECDPGLIRQVFANLLSNALKFSRPRTPAVIEVGVTHQEGERAFFVRDNGVGFNMKYVHKLFGVFQRLHGPAEFEGTGVGLATVQRIIHKHGGRVWAEAELDKGATFYFTLGSSDEPQADNAIISRSKP